MQLTVDILFLLLPVAALSGWLIGRNGHAKSVERACQQTTKSYVEGLNYLLSDEEDKAVDLFLQLSQDSNASTEIHFALANLYKRRGEVERAIRIHQHLIAQPTLDRALHNRALYELALDYLKAGLFDRAETLFIELRNDRQHGALSSHQLLIIYRQEKEWEKAATICEQLVKKDPDLKIELAHYYCEMAEQALNQSENRQARRLSKQALAADPKCTRASVIEGELYYRQDQLKQAIKAYRAIEEQDSEFLPQVLPIIVNAYIGLGKQSELIEYIDKLLHQYPTISLASAIYKSEFPPELEDSVRTILTQYLHNHPSILSIKYLIEERQGDSGESLAKIKEVIEKLWQSDESYVCTKCGFLSKTFYWNCPSCKSWSTMKIDNHLTPSTNNHLLGI
ncbi:MAG TPA: lipopolysaccharide assembly protein LapB [Ectothiorhodospiraceae bacterium]|nr:lipopolysaccharide assembly protein LapB [Ectothiorhodospiraceae bacterium]